MLSIPGLALHVAVVPEDLQKQLLDMVFGLLDQGRQGLLEGKTYAPVPPNFAPRGQSRELLQFGAYTHSNRVEETAIVAPLPELFLELIDVLEKAAVFDPADRPDTCTVNIYSPGNWLPPHVDSLKFQRPFVTVSLQSEADVLFGLRDELVSSADGNPPFSGESLRLAMPIGSALRLQGIIIS
jgi:hypothetical protein